jgi:hypothetical protein
MDFQYENPIQELGREVISCSHSTYLFAKLLGAYILRNPMSLFERPCRNNEWAQLISTHSYWNTSLDYFGDRKVVIPPQPTLSSFGELLNSPTMFLNTMLSHVSTIGFQVVEPYCSSSCVLESPTYLDYRRYI